MYEEYRRESPELQEDATIEDWLLERLLAGMKPLLERMDAYLDYRLVNTGLLLTASIISLCHPKQGLHLSRLGAVVKNGAQAPAGTKRIEKLLHAKQWDAGFINEHLWQKAREKAEELRSQKKLVLCIHDGSTLEKPESERTEGFSAVRSSKAKRLKKKRKGVYNPGGRKEITVLGMEWEAAIVVGMEGTLQVAAMDYWSRKGEHATSQYHAGVRILWQSVQHLGRDVWHVYDRGHASRRWLETWYVARVKFVTRWKGKHKFLDENGEEKLLWQIARGKRTWGHRYLEDAKTKQWIRTGVVAMPVRHVGYGGPLWLVVGRGKGDPWYLITNQPVETEEDAWRIIMAYARRWKIEECFRFEKCELGVESVRTRSAEAREKLLGFVTLAYTYLLSLCEKSGEVVRKWLLRQHCHRTGKRYQQVEIPLYRLRWALADLWQKTNPMPRLTLLLQSALSSDIRSKNSG